MQFPTGTHEFMSTSFEDMVPTNGFVAGLMSRFMRLQDANIWISTSRSLFSAALKDWHRITVVVLWRIIGLLYS